MSRGTLAAMTVASLGALVGCGPTQFSTTAWNPRGLTPVSHAAEEPIRIAVEDSDKGVFDAADWAFIKRRPPWERLERVMGAALGRRVQFEQLKPFQIEHHVGSGRCQFAFVSGGAYENMRTEELPARVLLRPRILRRQGVIVANAESDIQLLSDLAGRRFAFGPRRDPVLFYSALEVLDRAGVSPSDLRQELVITGFDGSLQNHPSSRDAAREIVYGLEAEAGVIERDEYAAYPPAGGQWVPLFFTLSKNQFRVIGETDVIEADTLDDCHMMVGENVDPELTRAVRALLIGAHVKNPHAIQDLGFARFEAPGSLASRAPTAAKSEEKQP